MTTSTLPLTYFSPASVFWRVNREWLIGLAGTRALLLELAHPLLAEGVAQHSDYRRQPFKRLFRTLQAMTDISFGDTSTARQGLKHFHHCHQPVTGTLQEKVGPFAAGTAYQANDPALKLWVLATLIDSVLQVHELFVAPLTPAERRAYYTDCQQLGHLLGLTTAQMPATYFDFTDYMNTMLRSEELTVGATARDIVQALFYGNVLGPVVHLTGFVGIGLLPNHLREAFGFKWSASHSRWLLRVAHWGSRLRPYLPNWLMVHPTALRTESRLAHQRISSAEAGS